MSTEVPVSVEVRKVQTFSRIARRVCWLGLALVAFGAVMGVLGIVLGWKGTKIGLGSFSLEAAHLTTPFLKAYGLAVVVAVLGVVFYWLYGLYALFGNLARGSIFTSENVRLIRQAGLLMLLMVVLIPAIGFTSFALLRAGIINEALVINQGTAAVTPSTFTGLLGPGLVLLASWIMEVGRKTRVEADEMRRETELMV
jgi:Protein of unknown function (DUF2975)